MPSAASQPLILTAADARFFRSLWQFLLSLERTGLSESCAVRAYDLGLDEAQAKGLTQRFPWCEQVVFDFARYPLHVSVASNSYAWKPIIIAENLEGASAPVFWFDSATLVHTRLEGPLHVIASNGLWILKSQSPLHQKCDPRVMDALNVPLEVRHVTERAAGALGLDPRNAAARKLIEDWKKAVLDPDIVVPASAASYHKQDQAVLNCLLLPAAARGELVLTEDEIDISSMRPARDITTRNRVDPRIPHWADILVRGWFRAYKTVDALNHRWQRFHRAKLGGLDRWRKEHFTVYVQDLKTGLSRALPSPRYGYYADPFIVQRGGRTWLFMEEYQYAKDNGRLVVMELSPSLEVLSVVPLIAGEFQGRFDCHASYPFVFELDGAAHMIPETSARGSVDLYVCDNWPVQWRIRRRLMFGVDAADTMVLRSSGLWWLFTSVRSSGANRHLEIHYTDDLVSGELHPHPCNSERQFADARNGTGRNAGYLASSADGAVHRLMQDSADFYGEGVSARRIEELTEGTFREVAVDRIPELPVVSQGFRSHHVSRAGDLIAYDVRDRAR